MHRPTAWRYRSCLLLFPLLCAAAYAQPSGGPYGPIDRTYKIPKAPHVYYVAPDGDSASPGTLLKAPTSIEAAVEKAVTGDAIVLRGGVYRTGSLTFNQKIVFQPYGSERPVLKGTEVATKWEAAGDHVWKTSWTKLFPAAPLVWWNRKKEEAKTPLHRFNNDMVFVDGAFLKSAGSVAELDPHSYYIDYANSQVYIGTDPANRLVEITAHDGALIRTTQPVNGKVSDKKGPVLRGLTITQYARRCLEVEGKKQFGPNDEPTNEPLGKADPSTYGKDVTGTTLENMTISYCSRVAGWFRGDHLVIKNSLVSDTSTEGIYVIGSSDVLLERNIVRRNNIEQLTGYYPSAVKIFNQTHRVTFRDNLVLENPYSNGVWYDVGNRDGVFTNNYVEGALVGFFFEISRGVTVAGNVFVRNGRGVWILNSADAHVYNNTFYDNSAGFTRTERSAAGDLFDWHPATGPGVEQREGHIFENNLLVASDTYRDSLLRFEQSPVLSGKLTRPQATKVDGNVYARAGGAALPLITWAPTDTGNGATLDTLAEFRKLVPKFEAHSRLIDRTPRSVFKGPDIGRYELRAPVPATVPTPASILKLLGWGKVKGFVAGAYPFKR
jgi:parallel beta-helix repeat protein